jgi:hypothetical protein
VLDWLKRKRESALIQGENINKKRIDRVMSYQREGEGQGLGRPPLEIDQEKQEEE